MYEDAYELTMEQALFFLQESDMSPEFKENIVDPIMNALASPSIRNRYIKYGDEFLAANADMLAKEYPTRKVSFPQQYVDGIITLFGYQNKEKLTAIIRESLNKLNDKAQWNQLLKTPTNFIHAITLYYSDLIQNRKLRDSARQQLALTMWYRMYDKYWGSTPVLNEGLMAYTYSKLNLTWDLVRAENMMNWITEITEGAYALYRTKLDIDLSVKTVVMFLNETRNRFNQKTKLLSIQFYNNKDAGVIIGDDVSTDDGYIDTNSYSNISTALMRLIKNKDKGYWAKGELYKTIARWKNVDVDSLFDFATKQIKDEDISRIMNLIFYVYLVKEGHTIKEIQSKMYIDRITKFPTAIDRCIAGKPVIKPLVEKYGANENIVRAYVCLIATYILQRLNDVNEN